MSQIKSFFRLIRFLNLAIVVFTQFIARIFIIGPKDEWLQILIEKEIYLLSLSTVLIAAAGYIINDYYDVKIDVINKPRKIVIDRDISRRNAIILHFVLNSIALIIGWNISFRVMLFFLGTIFLLWLYSNQLKRIALIGNITVALLSSSTIILIGLYYPGPFEKILFFGLLSFIVSLIREIIKDMEDLKGDITHGCKTLPIVWGIENTKTLIQFLIGALVTFLIFHQVTSIYFGLFINLILGIEIIYLAIKIHTADKKKDFDHLSSISKIILITGVFIIIFIAN